LSDVLAMRGPSFRLLARTVVPGRRGAKRLLALAALLALAGCGGKAPPKAQALSGPGFDFTAPGGWKVTAQTRSVEAASGDRAVSVTVFALKRAFRPALWPKVVPELDGVAASLADQLRGLAGAGTTVTVAGRRARRYDISFSRGGKDFVERITFVLDGKREFQLLCRYPAGADEPACAALGSSFRLR
jgi:predicted small lipoprotein YifL